MREALFRILAGVFAAPMVFVCIFLVFSFPDFNSSIREVLEWVSGVGFTLVLTATFSAYAILGQERAHLILNRGMRLLGRGNLPEVVFERSKKKTVDLPEGLDDQEPEQLPVQADESQGPPDAS